MSESLIGAAEHCLRAREQAALEAPDDALFYCAYLLGHLNLVAAEQPESDAAALHRLQQNLERALRLDRLSDQDRSGIRSLWKAVCGEIGSPLANPSSTSTSSTRC